MNTVAPRYMAEAVSNYLKNLQEQIGDLDEFVRDRLGYKTKEDLYRSWGPSRLRVWPWPSTPSSGAPGAS